MSRHKAAVLTSAGIGAKRGGEAKQAGSRLSGRWGSHSHLLSLRLLEAFSQLTTKLQGQVGFLVLLALLLSAYLARWLLAARVSCLVYLSCLFTLFTSVLDRPLTRKYLLF